MSKKRKILSITLLSLLVILQVWIYSNSVRDGMSSTEQSSKVTEIVTPVYEEILPKFDITPTKENISHYVRKTAHFTEYAMLGFLGIFMILSFKPRSFLYYCISLPACALSAGVDECIQLFTDGRSGQLTDVLLDSCGAAFGILAAALIILLVLLIRKIARKTKENK